MNSAIPDSSPETVDTRGNSSLARKWKTLSPTQQKLIVIGSAIDTAAKAAALVDLARRPSSGIRGPKWAWAAALPIVNSAGLLPTAYFVFGRRR